jgi:hypothetical protein
MAELKPCRCRKNNKYNIPVLIGPVYEYTGYYVKCEVCGKEGPFAATEQRAIDAWNKRSGK